MGAQFLPELAALIEEISGVSAADITSDKRLVEELGLDSLAVVEIAMVVKEKWGIRLAQEDLSEFKTVQDILDRLAMQAA